VGCWVKPKVPTKCRILAAALTVHCMHGLNDSGPSHTAFVEATGRTLSAATTRSK
jgi:hypothetical protein